ncbi:hypothetical protein OAH41_06530 [Paracoccaceae bacterium]|nr:hypothetical protein [Paracoccaceae bacterium]
MAIQISGTTVINNSRQLQNIASLDSTTISTISAAAGGSPIPDWGGDGIPYLLQQLSGTTTSTAAANVSYASNYVTITGAGNGTFIRGRVGSYSTAYPRTFYIKHSSTSGWHRDMSTAPWGLFRGSTTELNLGSYGGGREFHIFVPNGANVRMRTSTFNLVVFQGYKVDL